ncbi:uncharacterized protein LOC107805989 [Nicotiana tabacum]|uniref:uncharacterized protein LOC107805989 n=1 Tax=Nicotiana tabacum TaxID=4097 RepID=UPI00388C63FE
MATESQPSDLLSSSTRATGVSIVAGSVVSSVVDSAHPYYLHPSDYPGMSFVSSMFDGRGYGGWRRAVVIAQSTKNNLGFIDGTLVVPAADSGLQRVWARCNDMVLSWLLNSLSKEIAESVLYSQSAKDLWADLEDRFGQINGAKLFQLQKELSDVVQENSSVTTYFTKMKSLWDELDALNTFSACVCDCDCGAKIKNHKAHQDERLLQFLMGLNKCFIGVISNIMLSSSLPTIGEAYSLVIQDKKQREIHATPAYLGDFASFIVANQPGWGKRHNEQRDQKGMNHYKRVSTICGYCKRPGHTIGKCYRIHGFPTHFKFTRQNKFQGPIQANNALNAVDENEQAISVSETKSRTQENVVQLLQLL